MSDGSTHLVRNDTAQCVPQAEFWRTLKSPVFNQECCPTEATILSHLRPPKCITPSPIAPATRPNSSNFTEPKNKTAKVDFWQQHSWLKTGLFDGVHPVGFGFLMIWPFLCLWLCLFVLLFYFCLHGSNKSISYGGLDILNSFCGGFDFRSRFKHIILLRLRRTKWSANPRT